MKTAIPINNPKHLEMATAIPNYSEEKAFKVFAAMCWEQHMSRHPTANIDPTRFAEISTARWKGMTQEQKNAFHYKLENDGTKSEKVSKEKGGRIKDPNKPKGKKSAYICFSTEIGAEIRKENPEMSTGDVSKVVGTRWKELDEEKRKKYEELAETDKKRYEQEMALYNERMPQEQKNAVNHKLESDGTKSEKAPKGKDKNIKDPNMPKGKKGAFICFSMEIAAQIRKENPEMSTGDVSKAVGTRWKELEDEKRKKYQEMAETDKKRYEQEMALYKEANPEGLRAKSGKASKRKGKSIKDPNKPKKQKTAYICFATEIGAQIRKENPEMAIKDVLRAVGPRWKELEEEKRKKYQEMEENDKQRYEQEMALYNEGKFSKSTSQAAAHNPEVI